MLVLFFIFIYILCDDGVYVISDTLESEIMEAISSVIQYSPTPIKLPSRFENFINIFPSYFSAFRKLGKSARSSIDNKKPPSKKCKVVHDKEIQNE